VKSGSKVAYNRIVKENKLSSALLPNQLQEPEEDQFSDRESQKMNPVTVSNRYSNNYDDNNANTEEYERPQNARLSQSSSQNYSAQETKKSISPAQSIEFQSQKSQQPIRVGGNSQENKVPPSSTKEEVDTELFPRKFQPPITASSVELGQEFYAYNSLNDDLITDFIEETKQQTDFIPSIFVDNSKINEIQDEFERNVTTFHQLTLQRNMKNHLFIIENDSLQQQQSSKYGNEEKKINEMEKLRQTFRLSLRNCGELLQKEEQLSKYNQELMTIIQKNVSLLEKTLEKSSNYVHSCAEEFQRNIANYTYALKWNIHLESLENIERVRLFSMLLFLKSYLLFFLGKEI
jgi:hypothetical protein